ncbi:MFS family permease [Saccharothrix tamanrassetensis]|uniref:MFS family permease n=1 Tax=Saccharothrix tamanrassetensis TaxID=1051531 RepID=A0A841CWJ5_9PSEU|nr:MFS transporter [Saccharothrix tamanrassetensis]MBB5960325.1 MFS family permease [Saccharothrix tamanrassetensis]
MYALLFADNGMSDGQISALFAIWSTVAVVAEVPFGALADRFSRRWSLVAAGLLQALGYALWTASPGFWSFAGGFVLWGLGGALVSGALEALLHDGLTAVGAADHFGTVLGRVTAVGLLGQIPSAVAATFLFSTGGYALVGWVSVATCLGSALMALRLPETPRGDPEDYFATLRSGLAETAAVPAVRRAVPAVAVLAGLDALEEYFPLLARDWDVPVALVPLAVLAIPLAGAAGAALGGTRLPLGGLLAASALLLGAAGLLRHPAGLAAVAVFYGLYRLVLVVAETRLQERITGSARATVTSVAGLGSEVAAYGVYAAWVFGGLSLVSVVILAFALVLPYALRVRRSDQEPPGSAPRRIDPVAGPGG